MKKLLFLLLVGLLLLLVAMQPTHNYYKAVGYDELGKIGCDTLINHQDFLALI